MLTSITRLEMGGVGPGIDLTLDDDQSDPTEASPGLDDAVADRIQEIQSGGDWRKTKALRQKHLSRKEGAKVTKRNKQSTKALWKQALVTRSAAAESQSDSELAHDPYGSSGRVEHSAATTVAAQAIPPRAGPFPPLKEVSFQELREAAQEDVSGTPSPDSGEECACCSYSRGNELKEEYRPAHGEDQCWSLPDSKESSKAEAWHQRLNVPPLMLPRDGEEGLTLTQREDKSVRQEDQGKHVLDVVPEETDSEQGAPKSTEVKVEAWTKVGKRVGKIPLSSLFQGSTPRGTVRRTTGRTDGGVH